MILWLREGLFTANETRRVSIRGVRCAKCAPSAYGDFAKSRHLRERKLKILLNVSTAAPSYLAYRKSCVERLDGIRFASQTRQIEKADTKDHIFGGIFLANVDA